MRVYGDRAERAQASDVLEELEAAIARLPSARTPLDRHAARVAVLIRAGMLHQGVADLQLAEGGVDDDTPAQRIGLAVVARMARWVGASWDDDPHAENFRDALALWRAEAPADALSLRVPEGFAHYAVYPEAYLEAARAEVWSERPCVIGLRSIGVTLAGMSAAAFPDDPTLATLRPVGAPFARRLEVAEPLRKRLLDQRGGYLIVDEGPGLSGSSFGCVADMLEAGGVSPTRLAFSPSHAGAPGAIASSADQLRWASSRRLVADFDSRVGLARLSAWAQSALGGSLTAGRDLSGGRWRDESGRAGPVVPTFERRKFLFEATSGAWLLKFAGLGREGRRKAERACALAEAGFSPAVGGLAHGFIANAWIRDGRAIAEVERPRLIVHLARYLAFRARRFPAEAEEGASLEALADMARVNACEALGDAVGDRVFGRLRLLLDARPRGQPVHVDGRLHAWEWLLSPAGEILKTDAVDHSCGHDLVGCQDISWDVAGAALEFDLTAAEVETLLDRMGAEGVPVSPRLLDVHRACYPAFQLGLWSFAPPEERLRAEAHARRYRAALLRFAEIPITQGEDPWMEARRQAI